MTNLYFVRHAQPEQDGADDRNRPLTRQGLVDSQKVTQVLHGLEIAFFISSPYRRSVDTLKECAQEHGLVIVTDTRLRERQKGPNGDHYGMYQKRWNDFDFHEDGGESLRMVQKRNIEAVLDILKYKQDKAVVIGTHGTALSMVLNYFDPTYGCGDFLRMIDFMPYILRLDFEAGRFIRKTELLVVEKTFLGKERADKRIV